MLPEKSSQLSLKSMKFSHAALLCAATLLTATASKAQTVFLSFSGGGGTPIVITLASPITYTITGVPNPGTVDPYFVFSEVGNIFQVEAPLVGGGAPSYTGVGIPDPTLTINRISSGESSHGAIDSLNDIKFRHAPSAGVTFLFTGEVFNLTAGTFTTANSFFGPLPTDGYYETFIMDASYTYLGAGTTSAIPEPSTYALLAGAVALALAGWQRRAVNQRARRPHQSFPYQYQPKMHPSMKPFASSLSLVRRHSVIALLASGVLLMLGTSAQAQIAVSNLGQSAPAGVGAIGRVGGGENHRRAFSFTTGSSATSFDFTSITMAFSAAQGSPSLSVGLYSAFSVGSVGGSGLLTSLTLSSGNPYAAGNAVFSGTATLAASTTYFVQFDAGAPSAGNSFFFPAASSTSEDGGGLAGWSIGDTGYHAFPNAGSDWAVSSDVGRFSVQATETASAIPEPSTYAAMAGAAALGLAAWRRRQQKAAAV